MHFRGRNVSNLNTALDVIINQKLNLVSVRTIIRC